MDTMTSDKMKSKCIYKFKDMDMFQLGVLHMTEKRQIPISFSDKRNTLSAITDTTRSKTKDLSEYIKPFPDGCSPSVTPTASTDSFATR